MDAGKIIGNGEGVLERIAAVGAVVWVCSPAVGVCVGVCVVMCLWICIRIYICRYV